eukprot:SAG11_NODE_571_length_8451_cov_34.938218_5_plen_204_part_00
MLPPPLARPNLEPRTRTAPMRSHPPLAGVGKVLPLLLSWQRGCTARDDGTVSGADSRRLARWLWRRAAPWRRHPWRVRRRTMVALVLLMRQRWRHERVAAQRLQTAWRGSCARRWFARWSDAETERLAEAPDSQDGWLWLQPRVACTRRLREANVHRAVHRNARGFARRGGARRRAPDYTPPPQPPWPRGMPTGRRPSTAFTR